MCGATRKLFTFVGGEGRKIEEGRKGDGICFI